MHKANKHNKDAPGGGDSGEGGLYKQCVVQCDTDPSPTAGAPGDVISIPPFHYCYIMDTNKNVTRIEVGPQRFTCQEHEKVVLGLTKMLVIPPMHYAIIENPVMRASPSKDSESEFDVYSGEVLVDSFGQAKLRHGDFETRFHYPEPFPLFPGEILVNKVLPLKVVSASHALRLRATRDFVDRFARDARNSPIKRIAGEEWLFRGPATYLPQVEVEVVETVKAIVLLPDQAVMLRARRNCVDQFHKKSRKTGEMWLVRTEGAYLPDVDEELVKVVDSVVLSPRVALHLRAARTFTDTYGVLRKAGEEWLVTSETAEKHLPDVHEVVVQMAALTVLTAREYCVILDPWSETEKRPLLGTKKVVAGPKTFFLQPFERLENGIEALYLLEAGQALLVRAKERFTDDQNCLRDPGCSWMVHGPQSYVPPPQVEVRSCHRSLVNIDALGLHMLFLASCPVKRAR
ncbi:major vault protein [Pelomyxa schiedti]|nr:major vault protein [Pelomyxa schiedti]